MFAAGAPTALPHLRTEPYDRRSGSSGARLRGARRVFFMVRRLSPSPPTGRRGRGDSSAGRGRSRRRTAGTPGSSKRAARSRAAGRDRAPRRLARSRPRRTIGRAAGRAHRRARRRHRARSGRTRHPSRARRTTPARSEAALGRSPAGTWPGAGARAPEANGAHPVRGARVGDFDADEQRPDLRRTWAERAQRVADLLADDRAHVAEGACRRSSPGTASASPATPCQRCRRRRRTAESRGAREPVDTTRQQVGPQPRGARPWRVPVARRRRS